MGRCQQHQPLPLYSPAKSITQTFSNWVCCVKCGKLGLVSRHRAHRVHWVAMQKETKLLQEKGELLCRALS